MGCWYKLKDYVEENVVLINEEKQRNYKACSWFQMYVYMYMCTANLNKLFAKWELFEEK